MPALYRRYRPRTFAEVLGQPIAVRIIQNSLRSKRVPQSLILSGGWGSGKTTCARLLAKAVNCTSFDYEAAEACDECASCEAANAGRHPDIIETDAASHGRVDDFRKLRDNAQHRPTMSKRKVYIADEVHQATQDAFDAILKLIEEPPGHAMFIFATTDPDKLPNTILSRCMRLDFRLISPDDLSKSIRRICDFEGQEIAEGAISEIVRVSNGSLRDAQSLLEQAMRLCDGPIKASHVRRMLGVASPAVIEGIVDAIARQDAADAVGQLRDACDSGLDPVSIFDGIIQRLRNLLWVTLGLFNPSKGSSWATQARLLGTAGVRTIIGILLADWREARSNPLTAQVMLEIKISEACEISPKA